MQKLAGRRSEHEVGDGVGAKVVTASAGLAVSKAHAARDKKRSILVPRVGVVGLKRSRSSGRVVGTDYAENK